MKLGSALSVSLYCLGPCRNVAFTTRTDLVQTAVRFTCLAFLRRTVTLHANPFLFCPKSGRAGSGPSKRLACIRKDFVNGCTNAEHYARRPSTISAHFVLRLYSCKVVRITHPHRPSFRSGWCTLLSFTLYTSVQCRMSFVLPFVLYSEKTLRVVTLCGTDPGNSTRTSHVHVHAHVHVTLTPER